MLASSHDRVFSAGGDLKAFASETPTIEKYAGLDRFPRLYELLGDLGKPVICAAGGDVLALVAEATAQPAETLADQVATFLAELVAQGLLEPVEENP